MYYIKNLITNLLINKSILTTIDFEPFPPWWPSVTLTFALHSDPHLPWPLPSAPTVQLLEFKIQQEKVLQEDLRASLDSERHRASDLSGQLAHEKSANIDLTTSVSNLQTQASKLRETLEREQSRYGSVT